MSELKLRRLMEHNQRLREDLARPRVRVSEASARYVWTISSLPSSLRILLSLGMLTFSTLSVSSNTASQRKII